MQPEQLTIAKLKDRLKGLNLPLNGRKVRTPSREPPCMILVPCPFWLPCLLQVDLVNVPGMTLFQHEHGNRVSVTALTLLMRV